MSQSPDIKSFRSNYIASKESANLGAISKSLAISQSQSKALERYFYRREATMVNKIELINLKKLKGDSYHRDKTVKNIINTIGDQPNAVQTTFEITHLKEESFTQCNNQRQKEEEGGAEGEASPETGGKVYRRTSDWTLIYNRNQHASRKSKKLESSDIKFKINVKKEKLTMVSHSNMDLILKKHKADNIKEIQQKMRSLASRATGFETQKIVSIRDYNRKCGFPEDTKVFIWNSEDEHIRRVLISWGWVLNPAIDSPFFHLKWSYTTHFNEGSIRERQLTNHYKNSQEMTSKSYLSKNLRLNQASFGKIDGYYPKCYDIGNQTEWINFMEQYRHNIMTILLKKIYNLFYLKREEAMRNFDLFNHYHFSKDLYGAELSANIKPLSAFRKPDFRQIFMEDYLNRDADFIIQVNLVTLVLKYWRNFRKNKEQFEDKSYHFLKFDPIAFITNFTLLQKYALSADLTKPTFEPEFTKEMYATPSLPVLERISKEYQFCRLTHCLTDSFGMNNLWIVKPTSNSRGNGIYLTADLHEIQSSSKGIQSRLVQKYIQKPLLIRNKKWHQLYMRKFDIRQWVLLKSLEPLEIYMFSECYLRLCHDSYDENETTELNRHLTNYSINKQKFKNKQESVLPLSYLVKVLKEEFKVDWMQTIRPQVQSIIVKSIKSCIDNFDDCGGSSFEMFGYDLLIDEDFKVWLLEINMSPACEERTDWLIDYLNDMTVGMFKIILPEHLIPQQAKVERYDWELVLKEEVFYKKKDVEQNLEIVGTGIGLENERKVDKFLVQNRMAERIVRFFRHHLPKYKQYKLTKACLTNKICVFLQTLREMQAYKTRLLIYNSEVINNYLQMIPPLQKYYQSKLNQATLTAHQYILSIAQAERYDSDLRQYQSQVLVKLGSAILMTRELRNFCQILMDTHQKAYIIQEQVRRFLQSRTEKKMKFERYLRTMTQLQKYEILNKQRQHEEAISVIETYFLATSQSNQIHRLIIQVNRNCLASYLTNLIPRKEFYAHRLDLFFSLVGRVSRVSRRRCRCLHFAQILKTWKEQLDKEREEALERENQKMKEFMDTLRERQSLKAGEEKNLKAGRIRQSKKN